MKVVGVGVGLGFGLVLGLEGLAILRQMTKSRLCKNVRF